MALIDRIKEQAKQQKTRIVFPEGNEPRIVLGVDRIQAEGISHTLERLQQLSALDPTLADHVDLDRTFRLAARLDGAPETILRAEHSVKRMRRKREADAATLATPPQGGAAPAAPAPPIPAGAAPLI